MNNQTKSIAVRLLSTLSCVAFLLLATGCASTGQSTTRQPFTVKLGQFKTALVDVSTTSTKSPEKVREFVTQLEIRIIAKLRDKKAFEKIYSKAADPDAQTQLGINVVVTSVRDVDSFDRVMFGAFAGQANTKATVEIHDRAAKKLLGSSEVVGKSSGGSVAAGTTTEAVDRVADEVVRLITEQL